MKEIKIDERKEIWKCLSEFYLDTVLQEPDYLWIANVLKKSNLTIEELKEIDLYEVFPTLQRNLNSVAGEWAGFNELWLMKECTKNLKKKDNRIFRLITRFRNKRSYWMRKKHWDKMEELIGNRAESRQQ